MKIVTDVESFACLKNIEKVGFVPTMGALHKGHISLVEKSLSENDITVVSIYVNPTQFDNKNDLNCYPKTFDDDLDILERLGVDIVFAPTYETLYPDEYRYRVVENDLSHFLCGASRDGHFDGVLTVVLKLFNIVKPTRAYFGEKDFQQLSLIKGMVQALFLNVEIISCPIVREESGLAMSSRNTRLSDERRNFSAHLFSTLSSNKSLEEMKTILIDLGFEIDYLIQKDDRKYAAVYIDGVRLIDNVQA